ncbi:MAG: efflux RND transporter permease subunit [Bacteroidaceae bacterium]|nr:efflux RND transporter permease subunit [Bacteroidaceae bacterium]
MRISNFTLLLTLVILGVIGAALIPLIDVADRPRPRQGKTLTINFSWPKASAKVVEQNVTSRIEGLVAAVKGVESVESESYFGSGMVRVELKKEADVSSVKFEIGSLLRQVYKRLPEGVSHPSLSGGEVVSGQQRREETQLLLTYQVNAPLTDEQLKEYIELHVEPRLRQLDDVRRVEVTGGVRKYIVITYDPFILASHGLTAFDIETAIRNFMGRREVVGEVMTERLKGSPLRQTMYLTTGRFQRPLEEMPVGVVDGKTVYLNDLATYEYCDRPPNSYYRVNGLNTIYLNIHADAQANKIKLSSRLRRQMKELEGQLQRGIYLTLIHDAAQVKESELHKLVWRTLMSLGILLVFVWLSKRSWRYLLIMTVTLASCILFSIMAYWLIDIRLHIYSLAGITVSLGLIIDASVVMVDHYSYYRNRRAFLSILAALLTTIGSLVIVFWLPEFLQRDLYDFSRIIIVNLSVALLVACVFVPPLIEEFHYASRQQGRIRHWRQALGWKHLYTRYVAFTQRRRWVWLLVLLLAFGIPFHALPSKWGGKENIQTVQGEKAKTPWYARAYNATLGTDFFQLKCKDKLALVFGGTMRLFAQSISDDTYRNREEQREVRLHIRARMPLGGSVQELNEKVMILENFLSGFREIKRFDTRVESWGASVDVEFHDEYSQTSFPYMLENKVIGRIISIGGADWSTYGVSQRGFSNSLNLQYRQNRIEISGYNYDRLMRLAEDMCLVMSKNSRVVDLVIETPGHENQEDEFYMRYDHERMALYGFDLPAAHQTLRGILSGRDIERYRDSHMTTDMYLQSSARNSFDLWHLQNASLTVNGSEARLSDYMSIERRQAKNCIPRRNQEYVLRLAFNILGSYTYANRYTKRIISQFNDKMPVGYRCRNTSYGWYHDTGTQYWLLLLIVVIIYFVCAILFESLRLPLAIISLIPVSFIGAFLTYYFTGIEFGTGGFASLVLLSGLTVNAGIYVLSEYQSQLRTSRCRSQQRMLKAYVRAYNHKIVAVWLTVLSTVLGLVPFFIDGKSEPFWFSFAVGASGGLLFSILALVLVMPLLLNLREKKNR